MKDESEITITMTMDMDIAIRIMECIKIHEPGIFRVIIKEINKKLK